MYVYGEPLAKSSERRNGSSDLFLFSNKMVKAYRKNFTNIVSKKVTFIESTLNYYRPGRHLISMTSAEHTQQNS